MGSSVWSWNSKDHIDLDETGRWWNILNRDRCPTGARPCDHIHINAVEPDGNGLLISLRHTDAIYRISRRRSRRVEARRDETPAEPDRVRRPRSARHVGGQHDVRRLADGTVSVLR